jgi:hypothetical protein
MLFGNTAWLIRSANGDGFQVRAFEPLASEKDKWANGLRCELLQPANALCAARFDLNEVQRRDQSKAARRLLVFSFAGNDNKPDSEGF